MVMRFFAALAAPTDAESALWRCALLTALKRRTTPLVAVCASRRSVLSASGFTTPRSGTTCPRSRSSRRRRFSSERAFFSLRASASRRRCFFVLGSTSPPCAEAAPLEASPTRLEGAREAEGAGRGGRGVRSRRRRRRRRRAAVLRVGGGVVAEGIVVAEGVVVGGGGVVQLEIVALERVVVELVQHVRVRVVLERLGRRAGGRRSLGVVRLGVPEGPLLVGDDILLLPRRRLVVLARGRALVGRGLGRRRRAPPPPSTTIRRRSICVSSRARPSRRPRDVRDVCTTDPPPPPTPRDAGRRDVSHTRVMSARERSAVARISSSSCLYRRGSRVAPTPRRRAPARVSAPPRAHASRPVPGRPVTRRAPFPCALAAGRPGRLSRLDGQDGRGRV